ncbi:hypothetical protein PJ15_0067 [Acinetobacter sp. neg1]|nr:hypothetical protein PJ15_0067 [Acinetobacter sp. neg1]
MSSRDEKTHFVFLKLKSQKINNKFQFVLQCTLSCDQAQILMN